MNEPKDNADKQFAEQAKTLFDDSVASLDAAALSRLNRDRHAALEATRGNRLGAWGRWLPATGIAAALLVSVIVMRGPDTLTLPADSVADFEILLEADSLEMYEELEFYSWLETADLDAQGNAG